MIYKPSESELVEIETLSADQRLHYFLTRVIESEEVWGLGDEASGWIIKDSDEKTLITVWPYEILAAAFATQSGDGQAPVAVSLEQFVYSLLPVIHQQNIHLEILPTGSLPGKLMPAQALAAILEGMMESGEYYMEG